MYTSVEKINFKIQSLRTGYAAYKDEPLSVLVEPLDAIV